MGVSGFVSGSELCGFIVAPRVNGYIFTHLDMTFSSLAISRKTSGLYILSVIFSKVHHDSNWPSDNNGGVSKKAQLPHSLVSESEDS